jgi:hypothetical protein
MGAETEMGNALKLVRATWTVLLLTVVATPAWPRERFALVISGASGGQKYADEYAEWRTILAQALKDKRGFKAENVILLSEDATAEQNRSTQEGVGRALSSLAGRLAPDDLTMIVLIGHGTIDGPDAKFNLVGPDLDAREWAQLLDKLPGRLIFVNTSGSSYPFLRELSGPNRVVITATDSGAQRFDTVFPRFFAAAFEQDSADTDKNGRISIWEAFAHASHGVAQWYDERGQLATEHAVIDDNGDRTGKEAQVPGLDGGFASTVYLDPDPADTASDAVLAELQQRRAEIAAEIEALKRRKDSMAPTEYEAEFEKLAVELARVTNLIKSRS